MEHSFIQNLYQEHKKSSRIPQPAMVCNWLEGMLGILFPEFSNHKYGSRREFVQHFNDLKLELYQILQALEAYTPKQAEEVENLLIDRIPRVRERLLEDAQAILTGDPAASNHTEVIRSYPGFYAIAVYRLAHEFLKIGVPLVPRILTEHAHSKTGIDIHPGATIDTGFCIDHGTGVVIGETCHIGKQVKIYQGVTLGALSVRKELAKTKRHPTIEDRVVIYSGATILGGETTIGHDSIIGGNVWITQSVLPHCRIYYTGYIRQRQTTVDK
ncbi:MAG: serine acetyltransferase [Saprospiraceae bacterium]|nr:serine acetyltransferase [Saprospiraceae bacterium]